MPLWRNFGNICNVLKKKNMGNIVLFLLIQKKKSWLENIPRYFKIEALWQKLQVHICIALRSSRTMFMHNFINRLLIKIIDFYFPLFYYCLMTSAGGNVTLLSQGKIKLNYHPLNLNIIADYSLESCGFFTIIYLAFQKTIKLCITTTFSGNLNFYFTSGILCKVKIL